MISARRKHISQSLIWNARLLLMVTVSAMITLVIGCSRSGDAEDRAIARVEDRTLHMGDLKASTNLNITSTGEAAEEWIDQAVLTYHAGLSDFALDNAQEKRIRTYQQRLLSSLYLDSLLSQRIYIHPEEARFYYAENIDTFRFRVEAAIVYHFGYRSLETAESALDLFRSSTANIDSVVARYNYDRQLVYRGRIIPLFEETIFGAEPDEFVGPVKSDFGYHLFRVERFFSEGDAIPYAFVRKHILEKLYQQQLPLERLTILDSLREVTDIEISSD